MTADEIIERLDLAPHPEGGWYRQTWVAEGSGRPSGTCIYFLLRASERSHWHRVDAAEIWHHYAGAPLIVSISRTVTGPAKNNLLGPDILFGQCPQILVPAHHWQAAWVPEGQASETWALAGCTVSPGFSFDGFELAAPGFDIPAD